MERPWLFIAEMLYKRLTEKLLHYFLQQQMFVFCLQVSIAK